MGFSPSFWLESTGGTEVAPTPVANYTPPTYPSAPLPPTFADTYNNWFANEMLPFAQNYTSAKLDPANFKKDASGYYIATPAAPVWSWTTGPDYWAQKQALDQQYLDSIASYNQKYGTNVLPDQSVLGAVQPNPTYRAPDSGGWFDSLTSSIGDVIGGVGDAALNTIDSAMNDPLRTAAIIGTAIVAPELLPYVNAGSALAAGADPQRVALAVAAGQLGAGVSSGLADTLGTTGANIAGSTAAAAVRGQDPLAALVSGGIGAGTSAVTSQIEGFENLSPAQQRAVNTVVAAELQGRDPSQALVNQALNAGIAAARNEYNGGTAVANGAGGSAAESLMGSGLGRLVANAAGALPSSSTLSNLTSGGLGALIGGVTGGTSSAGLTGNPLVNNYLNNAMPSATPQDTSSMLANNLIYQAGLASLLNSGSNQGVIGGANQLINPSDVGTLGPAQTNWPGGLGGGLLTSKITGEAINGQPANTSVALQNAMNARRQYAA